MKPAQHLEIPEDILVLTPGDIVETGELCEGLKGPMLVSKKSSAERIVLIQRVGLRDLFRIELGKGDVRVENGQLKFNAKKGGVSYSAPGSISRSRYEANMDELDKAGL
jgi:hypothetical protein